MGPVLHGIGVSPGYVVGPLYTVTPPPVPASIALPSGPAEAELERAVAALATVVAELTRRAELAKPEIGQILRAQAMMADDQVLRDSVAQLVHSGISAASAIDQALAAYRAAFIEAGGYLAERAADLDDLRDRAIAVSLGLPMPGLPAPGHPFVLAARDLAPADTASLDPTVVLALLTEEGGPTSHTAIVARTLGIPAVVRCPGVLSVPEGTAVAVDGAAGVVRIEPDVDSVASARLREEQRVARLRRSTGPGRTADGHPVALLANIGSAADLSSATDAEGVGLFRTELLYLDRLEPPTVDEQAAAYTAVFEAAAGRRTVVRTLDAGADKPVPFLRQPEEPNPALGIRGIRLGWRRPEVLRTQLAAIAQAAAGTGADVWVMAPMVAHAAEAARFATYCREVGLPQVGVMIEIPAAALQSAAILSEVDFLSIGTNDLSQYSFAADRQCGELADLLDPWQPALLSLLSICAAAGTAVAKPVGVCGEAASDPALAVVLVGLGVTSLSMAPRAIPAVRAALAERTLDECRRLAAAAVSAADAATARRLAG